MTDYTLHNTKPKKKKTMSATTKRIYDNAVQQIYSKNPANLKQAMKLVFWVEDQPE